MERNEVVEKSLDLTAPILGQERAQKLADTVMAIESVDDVLALRPLLQA
jgi:hypothetical protein